MSSSPPPRIGTSCPSDQGGAADFDEGVAGKIVVLGLGNRYLGDDGIGILVADELQRCDLGPGVVVRAHQTFDLWLLSQFSSASRLIIVDALKSGSAPGTITEYMITPRPAPLSSVPGLHSLKLHELVDFASRMGLLTCPVTIIGVEPMACDLGEGLTAPLDRALPELVTRVVENLQPRGLLPKAKA